MSSQSTQAVPPVPTLTSNFVAPTGYQNPVYVYGTSTLTTATQQLPLIGQTALLNAVNLAQLLGNTLANANTENESTPMGFSAIAAPQIGEPWAMFIVSADLANILFNSSQTTPSYQVFINPVIKAIGSKQWQPLEGCLSYPSFSGNGSWETNRPSLYTFSFTTIQYTNGIPSFVHYDGTNGSNPLTISIEGISSQKGSIQVSQDLGWTLPHETDHTNGKLFTDSSVSVLAESQMSSDQTTFLNDVPVGNYQFEVNYNLVIVTNAQGATGLLIGT